MPRAQSAMEYLVTYGWAILIIAVVLAAFLYIGVFGSSLSGSPNICASEAGYACSAPVLNATGNLSIVFEETESSITITGLNCSIGSESPTQFTPVSVQLAPAQKANLVFLCPVSSDQVGASFAGTLWVQYSKLAQTDLVARVATISAKSSTQNIVGPISTSVSSSTRSTTASTTTYQSSSSSTLSSTTTYVSSSSTTTYVSLSTTTYVSSSSSTLSSTTTYQSSSSTTASSTTTYRSSSSTTASSTTTYQSSSSTTTYQSTTTYVSTTTYQSTTTYRSSSSSTLSSTTTYVSSSSSTLSSTTTYQSTTTTILAFGLDSSVSASGSTAMAVSLSTSHTNDILIVALSTASTTGESDPTITSSPSLTWTKRAYSPATSSGVWEYYAIWSGSGTISITVTPSTSGTEHAAVVFAVYGENSASPFDTSSTLPARAQGSVSTPSVTMSTSDPSDFLIGIQGGNNNAAIAIASPFTDIANIATSGGKPKSNAYVDAGYYMVTSTQTNLGVSWSSASSYVWNATADAVTSN